MKIAKLIQQQVVVSLIGVFTVGLGGLVVESLRGECELPVEGRTNTLLRSDGVAENLSPLR